MIAAAVFSIVTSRENHRQNGAGMPEAALASVQQPLTTKRRKQRPVIQRQAGPVLVEVLNSASAVKPSGTGFTSAPASTNLY